ncbi:MAG: 1-acyl-sn-glycerol-3-phosphate acyltransferase [Bacteroidota bacterium]|nr:1-acyl-sn-glycerol-3-phosphate acyltransferase [Bacteroidota bacterium]
MTNNELFDDIRSYKDSEVEAALARLIKSPDLKNLLTKLKTEKEIEEEFEALKSIKTIEDFQQKHIAPYARHILDSTIDKLTYSGLNNIKPGKNYLFVSNHRDIIIDSAVLNTIFQQNNLPTTEIGLGDNLLIFDWITDLVKLNKGYIVKRNIQGKEMLLAALQLSKYIRKKIAEDRQSVWIAQRPGRTKDGNDITQAGLLKMLILSKRKNILKALDDLNICPVTVSYENEPCEISKLNATYLTQNNIPYDKTPEEDLDDMGRGLLFNKGNVHINVSKEIKFSEKISKETGNENKTIENAVKLIDEAIYSGYRLFPKNYVAYDLLHQTNTYFNQNKYSKADKENFVLKFEETAKTLDKPKRDIKHLFTELYAYPVINLEKQKIY